MNDSWDPERTCPRLVGGSPDGTELLLCGGPLPCPAHSPVEHDDRPRSFVLRRDVDVSGVSGTGIVAWGCQFPDGVVVLRWKGDWPTSVVFHDRGLEAVRAVHGHDGRTQILWVDP